MRSRIFNSGIFILLLLLVSQKGLGQTDASSFFDVFKSLKRADSIRVLVDAVVDIAKTVHKFSPEQSTPWNRWMKQLKTEYIYFDSLSKKFSIAVNDSMEIEIADYRNSLAAFIDGANRLYDSGQVIREPNIRSYDDGRNRLLSAKGNMLRVINTYQLLTNELTIQHDDSVITRKDSLIFLKDSLIARMVDTLIRPPNAYKQIVSGVYISNQLYGVGYLHFFYWKKRLDEEFVVGADLLPQTASLYGGPGNRPTYKSIGGNLYGGLRYVSFLFCAGLSILDIPSPAADQNPPFRRQTMVSWNAGLLYRFRDFPVGLGFLYSPLYGCGIRVSCWLK